MRTILGTLCVGLALAGSAAAQQPSPAAEIALCVRAASGADAAFRLHSEGGVTPAYAGSPSDVSGPTLKTPAMLILPSDRPFSLRLDGVRSAKLVVYFCGSTDLAPGSPTMLTGPKGSSRVEMIVDQPLRPRDTADARYSMARPGR